MADFSKLLSTALQENNLHLSLQDIHKLSAYLELLQKWNHVYNLTAITAPKEMVYLHIIDSLLVQSFLHGQSCLDVGSGAGLPGIPLAIMNPDKQWVLLDKNSKKTRFLTQASAELQLTNVKIVQTSCEDFHPSVGFDSILSRAFTTLAKFAESTEHLLCPDGVMIAMKGKYPQAELQEIPPRFAYDVAPIVIKGISVERHVVCLRKNSKR